MKISILTLFPEMFSGPFAHSILKRAQEKGLVEIELINIRDFGLGNHHVVDDTPYGGGVGMVLKVDVLHKAIQHARGTLGTSDTHDTRQWVILMSATGSTFNQTKAKSFSKLDHLIIICGHYEGVDERAKQYIDEEISIGDFILTGGELPAMLISDAITRLLPGVITEGATEDESFSELTGQPLLEYPHYTRPQIYENESVPEILLSGDHKKIETWRKEKSLALTKKRRPDLLKKEN
jgi:tRNA (guanine37-N1)-methyltransferase